MEPILSAPCTPAQRQRDVLLGALVGKSHKGPQQHIPLTLCRGARGRKHGFHSGSPFEWIDWIMQTESMKRKNEEIA